MFCQSQASIRLKRRQKILWLFHFKKKPKVLKKQPEFQNLASKKPSWQTCYTRIENAHKVRKKSFHGPTHFFHSKISSPKAVMTHFGWNFLVVGVYRCSPSEKR